MTIYLEKEHLGKYHIAVYLLILYLKKFLCIIIVTNITSWLAESLNKSNKIVNLDLV